MLKVHFRYEHLPEVNQKAAVVIVYDSEELEDGSHRSANCTFTAPMLEKLDPAEIDSFYSIFIDAVNACIEHLEKGKGLVNDNPAD